METKQGLKTLREEDFKAYPLWRLDEETELYYPIMSPEEFPEYNRNLFIRTKFFTPKNTLINGYLVGPVNVYCIGLFCNGKELLFNKDLIDRCYKQFEKLVEALHADKTILIPDIFPLKYETTIDLEGYNKLYGEFDAFEKVKDKRFLRWKELD